MTEQATAGGTEPVTQCAFTEESYPGKVLKSAREKAALSLDDIHTKTLIPLWKLKALENDDYGQLGTRLFAIGYIRKFAKIVEVDAEPLLVVYSFLAETKSAESEGLVGVSPQIGDEDRIAPAYSTNKKGRFAVQLSSLWNPWVILVMVVLWVVATWVFTSNSGEPGTDIDHIDEGAPVSEAQSSASGVLDASLSDTETSEAEKKTSKNSVTSPDDSLDGVRPNDQNKHVPGEINKPVLGAPNRESLESHSAAIVGNNGKPDLKSLELSASSADILAKPDSPVVDSDTLVMDFSDECWVQVTDANKKVLFAKLQNKGDNLQLSGKGPFSVVLGNARVATLFINGREVPTEPRGADNFLRLRVTP